jgi:outer membrane lipoprotein LolB
MSKIMKLTIVIILTGLLCGCTSQIPSKHYSLSWQDRQQQLRKLHDWQINGYMYIQAPQRNFAAFLNWEQQQNNYTIYISGPLGIGSVKIYGKPGIFTLQTADGKKFTAITPEQLVKQQLGWELPISNMYYWIRGIPVPRKQATNYLDNYNHLTELHQQGWQIYYANYIRISNIDLPETIILYYPKLNVKIIVNKWII